MPAFLQLGTILRMHCQEYGHMILLCQQQEMQPHIAVQRSCHLAGIANPIIWNNQFGQCFLNADLHGAIISVAECKITALTGISGIMIRETTETFGIITPDDKLKRFAVLLKLIGSACSLSGVLISAGVCFKCLLHSSSSNIANQDEQQVLRPKDEVQDDQQDFIVQYDPPDDPKEYIHRISRTARGEGAKGSALLFLLPEELQFLRYLQSAKVPVKEYEFDEKKPKNAQSKLEKAVGNNYYLNKSAKEAYRSYLLAYNNHSMKDVFNVHRLDLQAVAASFCFSSPPKMNLNLDSSASKFRKDARKVEGTRNGFGPNSPYGRKKVKMRNGLPIS